MEMNQPFEAVIGEHADTVLRVCRVVLDVFDADDAWSETFLSAMRAYPDLAGRRECRGVAGCRSSWVRSE